LIISGEKAPSTEELEKLSEVLDEKEKENIENLK